jgi:hypothetical protein
MPLVVEITRAGERVKPKGGWDYPVLSAVYTAALVEASPDLVLAANGQTMQQVVDDGKYIDMSDAPIYYMTGCPLLEKGHQVLEQNHKFVLSHSVKTGRATRVLHLKKGDVLRAWRESK